MAQVWTLSEIRSKVRKVTGRPSASQISDTDINDYIDNYYRQVAPIQTQSDVFNKYSDGEGFTGTTVAGTGEYALTSDVLGIGKPFVLNGIVIPLSFDLEEFLLIFPPDIVEQSKPTNALLWERKIYLRPLPDDNDGANYDFEAPILKIPSSLADDSSQPVDELLGPLLAYGASIDIFMDNGQESQAGKIQPMLSNYATLLNRKDITAYVGRSSYPSF